MKMRFVIPTLWVYLQVVNELFEVFTTLANHLSRSSRDKLIRQRLCGPSNLKPVKTTNYDIRSPAAVTFILRCTQNFPSSTPTQLLHTQLWRLGLLRIRRFVRVSVIELTARLQNYTTTSADVRLLLPLVYFDFQRERALLSGTARRRILLGSCS